MSVFPKDSVINKALFKATIEEWRYNPALIPFMILGYIYLIGFSIISVTFVSAPIHEATFSSILFTAAPCVALLGAGIIGQNVSSGILSVLFARPMRRYSYVLTRWLALSVASSTLCLVLLVIEQVAGMAAFPGVSPDFNTLCQAVERVSMCFGLSATFVMLSSFLPNVVNLFAWLVLCFTSNMIVEIAQLEPYLLNTNYGTEWSRKLSEIVIPICKELAVPLQSLATPYIDLSHLAHATSISWFSVFTYFSNLSLCLLIAVLVMNRKEVSYANK